MRENAGRLATALAATIAIMALVACSPAPSTQVVQATVAPAVAVATVIPQAPTAIPDPTPEPPTPVPQPTVPPPPTVTATPAPTPRVIRSRAQTESRPAPDFEVETFDGETLRLSDLEGKVVVLNFWASWCPPCRWEMPFFESMSQEYLDRDVVFVGIAMSDTFEDASGFAQQTGVTYPLALDTTNEIVRAYEVRSLPTTFFISTDGRIERRLTSAASEGLLKIFIRGQLKSG